MNQIQNLTKGFLRENPLLVLVLGCCPALATTSSAFNGLGMGAATTFVLLGSNVVISLLAGIIPDKVRIPAFIVVIASFVTIIDLVMQAFSPELYETLGIFIPLIVVNCIVLGRAEAFASKNKVFSAFIDGLGMGLGFTMALVILGSIREILGSGALFGLKFIKGDGILVFILAPGAFIALGYLIALINRLRRT
ncbi:MAG TPA: electron transport complex subunit E [Bacteroidales bacterium]|nr:electron transport complex subunit E [Bacteroidales bacterium]HPF03766.1 electron transport complex subunit E [Bacteroidales bacterium]HPJ59496.1 electron transport complex subunit E [Bacteroidales bacterium]HPR12879.1 electron transport complex subunit E [Bacteroidales bacterium]HRW85094.1 electron transport complex subunit E [Bacteroidales bacterium]